MKKTILFLTMMLVSASIMFSQTATLSFPTSMEAPGPVFVPLTVDAIDSDILIGQWYCEYNPAELTYVGTTYPHPNFPASEWVAGTNGSTVGLNWVPGDFVEETALPGDVLALMEFTYVGGGCSDLIWGQVSPTQTLMYDAFFNEFTLTLIDGSVCPMPLNWIWEGNIGSDWFTDGNWNNPGFPGAGDDVIIPVTATPCVIFGGEAFCANMQIDAGVWFGIDANGALNCGGVLTNDGTLAMNSWPSGECSSILENGTAGGGALEYWRDTRGTGGPGAPAGWHYIAAPVAGWETHDIFDFYVNTWDEANGMWQHIEGGGPGCIPGPNMGFASGSGYSIKYDVAYACNGVNPGQGPLFVLTDPWAGIGTGPTVLNGTASGVGIPGVTMNFNLLGNPYPSYLYYEDFWFNMTGFFDAMYMWDDANLTYLTWIGGAGDANDGMIAPTQGFFFEAFGPATAPLTGGERYNVAYPWHKADRPGILLALKASGNNFENNTFIRFNEDATSGFDGNFDARNIPAGSIAPQLYTTTDGLMFDQNTMPATDMVTLNFEAGVNGIYTIEAFEAEMDYVVLEDTYTGETTDLLSDSYEFAYNQNEPSERFVIHFTPGTVGSNLVDIWSNANSIYVTIPEDVNGDIVVYNVTGQEVVRETAQRGMNIIEMSQSDNYFVVKVIAEEMTETGKVFIK